MSVPTDIRMLKSLKSEIDLTELLSSACVWSLSAVAIHQCVNNWIQSTGKNSSQLQFRHMHFIEKKDWTLSVSSGSVNAHKTYKMKSIFLLSSDFSADSLNDQKLNNQMFCRIWYQLTSEESWNTFRLCAFRMLITWQNWFVTRLERNGMKPLRLCNCGSTIAVNLHA